MGRVVLRPQPDLAQIEAERQGRFANLSTTEKLNELFALIDMAVKLNGWKPLKEPQGKGLLIRKPKDGYSE